MNIGWNLKFTVLFGMIDVSFVLFYNPPKKCPQSCNSRLFQRFDTLESFWKSSEHSSFFHPSHMAYCLTWDLKGKLPCGLNKNRITERRWTVKTCGELTAYVCVRAHTVRTCAKAHVYPPARSMKSQSLCRRSRRARWHRVCVYRYCRPLWPVPVCLRGPEAHLFDLPGIDWNRFPCVSVRLKVNNTMCAIHTIIPTLSLWYALHMAPLCEFVSHSVCVCEWVRTLDRISTKIISRSTGHQSSKNKIFFGCGCDDFGIEAVWMFLPRL